MLLEVENVEQVLCLIQKMSEEDINYKKDKEGITIWYPDFEMETRKIYLPILILNNKSYIMANTKENIKKEIETKIKNLQDLLEEL